MKTASEIAEEVLVKCAVASLCEPIEKIGYKGISGQWDHIWKRLIERVGHADRNNARKGIEAAIRRLRARTIKGKEPRTVLKSDHIIRGPSL